MDILRGANEGRPTRTSNPLLTNGFLESDLAPTLGGSGLRLDRTEERQLSASARGQLRARRKLERWTIDSVSEHLMESTDALLGYAKHALEGWNIDGVLRERLLSYCGGARCLSRLNIGSDMGMRVLVARHLIGQMLRLHYNDPGLHFYMITVVDDRRRTKDLITEVSFEPLETQVRGLLRASGIENWFGVKELQPFVNWEAGKGRDIAPHIHAIFWRRLPLTKAERARIERSRRFLSLTDAPTIKITDRERVPGEIAQMIGYLLKGPERGANLVPRRLNAILQLEHRQSFLGSHVQRDARIRPDLAIRMMEIQSATPLTSLFMASGEGTEFTQAIRAFALTHRTSIADHRQIADDWFQARVAAGKDKYRPVIFKN